MSDRKLDILLVAVVGFLTYLNNLQNGFVYDDRFIVLENPLVQDLDWVGLATTSYWGEIVDAGLYRPLTLLSFGVNRLFGADAFGYHLVNNALHAVSSVLVLLTAFSLGANRFTGVAAGLLFAVHPVHTEAVDAVVGRADLLAFAFAVGAFLAFVKSAYVPAGLLFFFATCAKESAVFALPLFVIARPRLDVRRWAPIVTALVVYAGVRVAVLGGLGIAGREIGFLDNPVAAASFGTRISMAFVLLTKYVQLAVWPHVLSADYSFNQIPVPGSAIEARVVLGVIIAAGLGFVAWKRRGLVALAVGAFLLPLTGVLHLFFPLGTLLAERLLYLPMLGGVLLIATALQRLGTRAGTTALAILMIAGTFRTVSRNRDWRDSESLFRRTTETSPQSARSYFLLGAVLLEQRKFAEAAVSFETGLAILPNHVGAQMSLGQAYAGSDDPVRAERVYRAVMASSPADDVKDALLTATLDAGQRLARDGDFPAARELYERAIELDPRHPEALNNLGLILEREGDAATARRHYREALAADGNYVPALLNLGSVQMSAGELADAEASYRRAVDLAPESYEAYNSLGIALARQGKLEEAEASFRRALAIDPDNPAADENLRAIGKTP